MVVYFDFRYIDHFADVANFEGLDIYGFYLGRWFLMREYDVTHHSLTLYEVGTVDVTDTTTMMLSKKRHTSNLTEAEKRLCLR